VFAPGGTPKEIVQRLHDEIAKALNDPSIKARIKQLGADPMPLTPPAFEAFLKAETQSNAAVIKAAGIAPN
jgi:tripartite-type tricarboxylate transporter receptor subunit TctC